MKHLASKCGSATRMSYFKHGQLSVHYLNASLPKYMITTCVVILVKNKKKQDLRTVTNPSNKHIDKSDSDTELTKISIFGELLPFLCPNITSCTVPD